MPGEPDENGYFGFYSPKSDPTPLGRGYNRIEVSVDADHRDTIGRAAGVPWVDVYEDNVTPLGYEIVDLGPDPIADGMGSYYVTFYWRAPDGRILETRMGNYPYDRDAEGWFAPTGTVTLWFRTIRVKVLKSVPYTATEVRSEWHPVPYGNPKKKPKFKVGMKLASFDPSAPDDLDGRRGRLGFGLEDDPFRGLLGDAGGPGWLGKLGFGGSDGGGPVIDGYKPGGGGSSGGSTPSGGGASSGTPYADRPSDFGGSGWGGGGGDAAPGGGGGGGGSGDPQDRGTNSATNGPQDRGTQPGNGAGNSAADGGEDSGNIGVKYVNGKEVSRWKVQQTRTPSETSDPSGLTGMTGDPFLDSFGMRTLRMEAGFLSPHLGPIRALHPDEESGAPGVTDVSGVLAYDPLAPYTEIYEGRDPRRPRGAASGVGASPYIEALYPDGGGDGGGGETVRMVDSFMADRPLAPGAVGDPHARVGGADAVVGTLAGVGKTTRAGRR